MERNLIHYTSQGWIIKFQGTPAGNTKKLICIFVNAKGNSWMGFGDTMIEAFSDAEKKAFFKEDTVTLSAAAYKRLMDALHSRELHPDFDYETTKGGRKQLNTNETPPGTGWMPNIYKNDGFERFEFHEEAYWMREKVNAPS